MDDNKFKKDLKEKFNAGVPDVLSKIKASPDFYVPKKPRQLNFKKLFNRKVALSFMSVFVLGLFVLVFMNRLSDPVVASTVTIDINPSIEVELDEDDFVIGVNGINDDGETILNREVNYRGLSVEKFIEILVNKLEKSGYLVNVDTENNIILFEVNSDNSTIKQRLEGKFESKFSTEMERFNAPYWIMNSKDIKMSFNNQQLLEDNPLLERSTKARLMLIYRILELDTDPEYTTEDLIELPLRDLYDIYVRYEDPDNLPDYDRMPRHRVPNNHIPFDPNKDLNSIPSI